MFLLKGCKETGFSFEALGTYVSSISDTYIHVRIVKIFKRRCDNTRQPSTPHAGGTNCTVAEIPDCLV